MKDELGRAEKKKKDSTSAIYKIRVFQFIQNGHNINGEDSPCLTAGLSIEDQHENTWTFISYTTNRPEQPHVVSLAFRSGDRPYAYDNGFHKPVEGASLEEKVEAGLKLLVLKTPYREALKQLDKGKK